MLVYMEILIAFTALTVLGIAAQFFGDDSRDDFGARPHPEHWHFPGRHG